MTTIEPARLAIAAALSAEPTPFRTVSLEHMKKAVVAEEAVPLSQTITDIMRYQSSWWIYDRDGWLLVDDEQLIASLDAAAREMATADQRIPPKLRP